MLGGLVLAAPLVLFAWFARRELARLGVLALLRTVYRVRAFGREHVPQQGGALLVPNHLAMIDGLWVGAALPRMVYFLMHRDFIDKPLIGAFTRMMGTIPVATGDTPEAKAASLRQAGARCAAGDLVCIFAEGVITRTGALMPFMRGLETIASAGRVPIVPVALDRVWGSLFSFSGGRFVWKLPRRLPFTVDVVFGPALPHDSSAWKVRDTVQELVARHREARAEEQRLLAYRFVRSARKNAGHPALLEAGRTLRYDELAREVLALGSGWSRFAAAGGGAPPGSRVGLIAAPGRAAAALCVVLAQARALALPLDPEHGSRLLERLEAAGVGWLVAERATLDALPSLRQRFGARCASLDELHALVGPAEGALARVASCLPGPLLARVVDPARDARQALAVVSGSGERPVVLSHANLIANVESLAQIFAFGPEDRVLATLPLDDALGLLAEVWLPLVCGAATVVPRSRAIEELVASCRDGGVTVLPLTPGQVLGFLAHATSADLASVRCAFCDGALVEPALLDAWQLHFGKPLYAGWGLPELSPVATVSRHDVDSGQWHHVGAKPHAVGRALAGVALRVVGGRVDELLPPGEPGELLVRGPGVFLGYLDDAAATRARLDEGWFRTGRQARLDKDGFLFLERNASG